MRRPNYFKNRRGVALLEFALFASMLLVILFGIIDLGRALFTANNITMAAREGGRYASSMASPQTPANVSLIKQRVAQYMSPFGNAPIDTATMISVSWLTQPGTGQLEGIRVQVQYPFNWITPVRALVGGTFTDTLHSRVQFRWESAPP
jgi:Flp pilus assembly protein TadG